MSSIAAGLLRGIEISAGMILGSSRKKEFGAMIRGATKAVGRGTFYLTFLRCSLSIRISICLFIHSFIVDVPLMRNLLHFTVHAMPLSSLKLPRRDKALRREDFLKRRNSREVLEKAARRVVREVK
jgi:hypothetical protein